MYFGCVLSPNAPVLNPTCFSTLKFCHPNNSIDSRIFLMYIISAIVFRRFEKASLSDVSKYRGHITVIESAELLERGGMHSVDVVIRLTSCLGVAGRYDLAELINALIAPHKLCLLYPLYNNS